MIRASFTRASGALIAAEVSGHAGFAEHGRDIACAAVTSAVQMAANGVTEVLKSPAKITAEDNLIGIRLTADSGGAVFLEALLLQLTLLAGQFEHTITITVSEV